MMAKPIKTLESHYPMIQFLINSFIPVSNIAFFCTGPMSIAVFITEEVILLKYVVSVLLSFSDVIKTRKIL